MARYSRVALYRVQNSAHEKHGNPIYFKKSKYNPEQIVSIPEAQREEPSPLTHEMKPGPPSGHPVGIPGAAKRSLEPVLKKKNAEVKKESKTAKSTSSKTMKKTGKMSKASPAKKASSKKAVTKKAAPKKAAKKMTSKKMGAKKTTTIKKATGTKKVAAKKSKKTKK